MDDSDARINRGTWRREMLNRAIEKQLSRRWLIDSRQHFAERAFARAVFAQQRVARAALDGE